RTLYRSTCTTLRAAARNRRAAEQRDELAALQFNHLVGEREWIVGDSKNAETAAHPSYWPCGVASQSQLSQARGFFTHRIQLGLVLGHCLLAFTRLLLLPE